MYNFPYYHLVPRKSILFLTGKKIVVQKYYEEPLMTFMWDRNTQKLRIGDRIRLSENTYLEDIEFDEEFFKENRHTIFFGCISEGELVLYDSYSQGRWNNPDFITSHKAKELFKGTLDSLDTLRNLPEDQFIIRCYCPKVTIHYDKKLHDKRG